MIEIGESVRCEEEYFRQMPKRLSHGESSHHGGSERQFGSEYRRNSGAGYTKRNVEEPSDRAKRDESLAATAEERGDLPEGLRPPHKYQGKDGNKNAADVNRKDAGDQKASHACRQQKKSEAPNNSPIDVISQNDSPRRIRSELNYCMNRDHFKGIQELK